MTDFTADHHRLAKILYEAGRSPYRSSRSAVHWVDASPEVRSHHLVQAAEATNFLTDRPVAPDFPKPIEAEVRGLRSELSSLREFVNYRRG